MEKAKRMSSRNLDENCFQNIQPFNIGIHSAWHRAADCQRWHELINTATLQYEYAIKDSEWVSEQEEGWGRERGESTATEPVVFVFVA